MFLFNKGPLGELSGFVPLSDNAVKKYLHIISGQPPLTVYNAAETAQPIEKLSVYGHSGGIGDYNSETGLYNVPIVIAGKNIFNPEKFKKCILDRAPSATVEVVDGVECVCVDTDDILSSSVYADEVFTNFFENMTIPYYTYTLSIRAKNLTAQGCRVYFRLLHDDDTGTTMTTALSANSWATCITRSKNIKTVKSINIKTTMPVRIAIDYKNAMVCEGFYTIDNMPEFEPYHEPTVCNINVPAPLRDGGSVQVDYGAHKAIQYTSGGTRDVSDLQDWNTPVFLQGGTSTITERTEQKPLNIDIEYYTDTPDTLIELLEIMEEM